MHSTCNRDFRSSNLWAGFGHVAQSGLEYPASNRVVGGSNPSVPVFKIFKQLSDISYRMSDPDESNPVTTQEKIVLLFLAIGGSIISGYLIWITI